MSHTAAGVAIQGAADATGELQQPSISPRVAHIVSVSGAQAVAILERSTAAGGVPVRVEIGATMTISTPQATVVGLVWR